MTSCRSASLPRIVLTTCLVLSCLPASAQDPIQTALPALHSVFADHFTFGAFLSYPHIGLPNDPVVPGQGGVVSPTGGYLVRHHMNFMGPGNNMKAQNTVNIAGSASAWQNAQTDEERDSINVHPVVRFNGNMIAQLNWAQRQGFTFRGHTLVWHNQTPGTAFFRHGYRADGDRLSPELMSERMGNYIKEVIRLLHEDWPGMVTAMDVVNEAILGDGNDRTQDNEWYTTFGDMSYVQQAFEYARQYSAEYGETQMMLYYNDFSTHQSAKANGIVRLLTPIFEAGLLDGIGMQQHDQWNSPSAAQWLATYEKFAAISHELAVTELDVNPQMTPPSQQRLQEQANQYAMFFKLFMDHSHGSGRGKIINVTKDGLNDQYAFVANASLWDANNQAKPAYYAVADVGIYYSALDTLIAYAGGFQEADHSEEDWSAFMEAHDDAIANMARNYTPQMSAAETLKSSYYALLEAVQRLEGEPTGTEEEDELPIAGLTLHQNYPNPFQSKTEITYEVPSPGKFQLEVYDLIGRRVATLVDDHIPAGIHRATFDASGVAAGTYVYVIRTETSSHSRMMHVTR